MPWAALLTRWPEAANAYQLALSARRQAGRASIGTISRAGTRGFGPGPARQAKAYIDELAPQLTYQTYAGIVELIPHLSHLLSRMLHSRT